MYKTEDEKRVEFTENLIGAVQAFGNLQDFKYRLEKADQMFDCLCPFNVDDRVEISRELRIGADSGWSHYRHFLVPGAVGTVKDRGWHHDHFYFLVQFDDQSRIGRDGKKTPISEPKLFSLPSDSLKALEFGPDFWKDIWS